MFFTLFWVCSLKNFCFVCRSKLFDELRENVYKEVVSLISANESRPHFLIQLFRDLQMIGSDALRHKILQSIQMLATHSLVQNSKRLVSISNKKVTYFNCNISNWWTKSLIGQKIEGRIKYISLWSLSIYYYCLANLRHFF